MFAIEVEYLLGRAVATDSTRRDLAEWPPHPQRLFSALVDAYGDDPDDADAADALRWLESLAPPQLYVSLGEEAFYRRVTKYFVPVNDELPKRLSAAPLVEQRKRQERYFPAVMPCNPRVQFLWPDATPDARIERALTTLMQRVHYLGHSSSLVRVAPARVPLSPSLVPASQGELLLRVPGPGRFDRLRQVYELRREDSTVQPPRGAEVWYRRAGAQCPCGPFGSGIVVAIQDGPPVDLVATAPVIDRLRDALLAQLSADIPEILSGHQESGAPALQPHLALLPLANVGYPYSDGTLKGFAAVLPRHADERVRTRLLLALQSVRELLLGKLGVLKLDVLPQGETPRLASLRFDARYRRPARVWVSVTPVALSRHPKPNKGLTEADIIAQDVERLGLPRPRDIGVGMVSAVRGAPRAMEFMRGNLKQLEGRLLRHVRIEFDEKVEGPLLVGAGRFMGFGLCLPLEGRER